MTPQAVLEIIDHARRKEARSGTFLRQLHEKAAALSSAYLCHRLMEEMHENNHSIRTGGLVDIEATRANLLVHQLIGEPFANELDDSITVTVLQIAGTPDYYELNLDPFVEQVNNDAWNWMREYWEHLLTRNHIRFSLGSGRP